MAESQSNKKKDAEKEKNTATLSKISNAIKGSEKLDVEGNDLLELLSHLEGELQARDVAIAALKSDQSKRIVYGFSIGTDKPSGPLSALERDKLTRDDANQIDDEVRGSTTHAEAQIEALQNVIEKQKVAAQKMAKCLHESEKQRARILEQLEDEKTKHERDTAQGDDITYELEKERIRLKQDLEAQVAEKQKLEVALKESLNTLEEEKGKQKQIVLVLLADRKKLMKLYLEEKKRSEDLAQMLQDEKTKMDTMAAGLEEESKRSLAMEAELEKHINQFGSERQQLRDKLVSDERRYRDLEDALRKARSDVDHFKKQLSEAHRIAMSQQSAPPPYQSVSPTQSQYSLAAQTPQASLNKFHSTSYNSNTSTGGFGHTSHPALIPAGVTTATISLMDQESLANSDIPGYSQMSVTKSSSAVLMNKNPVQSTATSTTRKPLTDSASSTNRKPALGKGVPPPVPPNKPVVPVKKDIGKRSDTVVEASNKGGTGMVAGLQGLKFGILSNSEPSKGIKSINDSHTSTVSTVPAKKFFNNIESKS